MAEVTNAACHDPTVRWEGMLRLIWRGGRVEPHLGLKPIQSLTWCTALGKSRKLSLGKGDGVSFPPWEMGMTHAF